jgi:hypothetical protein
MSGTVYMYLHRKEGEKMFETGGLQAPNTMGYTFSSKTERYISNSTALRTPLTGHDQQPATPCQAMVRRRRTAALKQYM